MAKPKATKEPLVQEQTTETNWELDSADLVLPTRSTSMKRTTCGHIDVGRTMHVMDFTVNGECSENLRLRVGEKAHVKLHWENLETECPGCIEQMYVGLQGTSLDCIFSDNENYDTRGIYEYDTDMLLPGTYKLVSTSSWQYSCADRTDGEVLATLKVGPPAPHNSIILVLALVGFAILIISITLAAYRLVAGKEDWQKIDVIFSDMPELHMKVRVGPPGSEGKQTQTMEFQPLSKTEENALP